MPAGASKVEALAQRNVGQAARAGSGGHADRSAHGLCAPSRMPLGGENDLASGARRKWHEAPRQLLRSTRRAFRKARRETQPSIARHDVAQGQPCDLRPGDVAATRGPRFDVKRLSETDVGQIVTEIERRVIFRSRPARGGGEKRHDQSMPCKVLDPHRPLSRQVPSRQTPAAQSRSKTHEGSGGSGTHRCSRHVTPSRQGSWSLHGSPSACASWSRSQMRATDGSVAYTHFQPCAFASGKSGAKSTHTRSRGAAPRRTPQIHASSVTFAATPAGASPPEQTVAPAISLQVHSPSSGIRG